MVYALFAYVSHQRGFMAEKKLKREKVEIIKYNNVLWF